MTSTGSPRLRAAVLTREFPPDVYGGAGVHVDFLVRELRRLIAVGNTRGGLGKTAMIHNNALPVIEVDAETYEVRADGVLLTCEPATVLPMAQRYFLF